MRNVLLSFVLLLFSSVCFSQITFEKGYFITTNGERTEVLLRNTNWGQSPEAIEYKLTPEGEQTKISVSELKEFAVYNQWKYIVTEVDVDRVETDLTRIGAIRNPVYKKETLPLKVLVEGKATLYAYFLNRTTLFFFSVDGGTIRQLLWKPYKSDQLEVSYNKTYQQQLWTEVRCNVKETEIARLDYKLNSLEKYFLNYNACTGAEVQHQDQRKKGKVSLSLTAGAGFSILDVERLDMNPSPDIEFKDNFVIQAGVLLEFVFPFNDNKTSLLVNPVYQSFSARREAPFEEDLAEYNSLLLSVGLRQYFFLSSNSKLFANLMGSFDVPLTETITYRDYKTRTTFGGAVGAGFMYKKLGVEARFHFKHDIINEDFPAVGDLSRGAILFSYKLF